jgi:hypothetical protein
VSESGWNLAPSGSNAGFPAIIAKKYGTAGTLTNIKLGKSASSTSNDFGGDLGELLIFTRQLTTTEEQKVEGYLAHKWGATDSLDANHPYKNVAPIFDNKPLISLNSLQADAIKVDFGQNNTPPLQSGYVGFNPWGSSSSDNGNLVEQTYSNSFGNSNSLKVSVSGQTHWRDYNTITGGPFLSLSNLLSDEVLHNSNGTITIKLSDVKAGEYSISTYHHASQANGNTTYDLKLTDANGANRLIAASMTSSGGRTPSTINKQTFDVVSDGTNDIQIMVGPGGAGGNHLVVNGLDLMAKGYISIETGSNVSIQVPATRNPTSWSASGLPTGLSINNSGVISGASSTLGVFNATINAFNADGNDSKVLGIAVIKGNRVITWDQTIAGLTYGDAPITLTATATGAGGLTYTSSDSSIMEINGTSAIIHAGGAVTLTAYAAENSTAFAAVPVTKEISIAKADMVLNGDSLSISLGDAIPDDLNWTTTGWKYSDASLAIGTNPNNLSNVALWLDATDSSTITQTSNAVSQWNDKSGNNHHASQSTSDRQPLVNTNSIGGKTAILFDGSDSLGASTRLGLGANPAITVFVVCNIFTDNNTDDRIFHLGNNSNSLSVGAGSQGWSWRYDGGNELYGSVSHGTDYLLAYTRPSAGNYASAKLFINGTEQTRASGSNDSGSPTSTTANFKIGSNYDGGGNFINGYIGEIIVIESDADSDRYGLEGYLAHKWGMADSLPNNHTHKSVSMTRGPKVTTTATSSSPAGTYAVELTGAMSDKYSFAYTDGELIISSLTEQTISWGQNFSGIGVGQTVDLNASASSNLAVLYTVDDTSVAELAVTNQSSLQAWWKLDESGGVDASDSSSNKVGSVENSTIGHWNAGKFGNAITFDGTNDHIRVYGYTGSQPDANNNEAGVVAGNRRTVALWFKTSTANKTLLQYGASGSGTLFKVSLNASSAVVLDLGGASITSSSTGLADGNWHHVVVTIAPNGTSGDAKLYIDGSVNNGSGSTAINTSTSSDIIIGRDGVSGSNYFNGQIDDVRFYGAEFNSTLVSQLYGNGNGDFNRLKVKAAGTVTLTANQPGNSSYAPAPTGSLSVTFDKSDQSISFNTIPDKSVGDFNFIPTAVASSGLPVTFSSSDSLVAEVQSDGKTIKIRSAGQAVITANQAGNSAYNAAPVVTQTLTVGYFNLQANSFPGIRLWLDANNIDGDNSADSINSGTNVIQWIDMSGNTNNAAQSVEANRPIYTILDNEGHNLHDKPVIRFANGDTFSISADSGIRTIAAIIRQSVNQSSTTKPFGSNQVLITSSQKFSLGAMDSGISSTSFSVVVWQMAPGAYSLHVDGVNKGSSSSSLTPDAFDKIGNGLLGHMAEIVAYDRALSDGVRQKIEGYLAHKWGLDNKLSSAHSYKVAKPAFGGAQVLTFQPIPDKQVGQTVTLDVSSDSGLSTFSFDSNDSSVVSFSGNVATALKVGKVTITATQAGQAPWNSASTSQPFIVTATPRVDQTITFADIPDKTVQSANFNLSATASSGLPVSFAVVSGNSATVETNGTVTITGAGVTTIRASQDGNGSYNPAPTVDKTLTVNKVGQTITFGALSNASLTTGTYALSATASSGLSVSFSSSDNTVAEVSGNILTLKKGGAITVTANQGGNGIYLPAPSVTQALTVIDDTQQAQTITWTQTLGTRAFGVADLNLTATASSGLAVSYQSSDTAVASIVGSSLRVIGAGTASITATQAGDGAYQAATPVIKTVTVTKANQQIVTNGGSTTLPDLTKDNGDFEFVPALKSRNSVTLQDTGLALSLSSSNSAVVEITGGGSKLSPKGPGTATITVSQAGDATYNAAANVTFTITVTELSPYNDSFTDLSLWLDGKDINGDQLPETAGSFLANSKVSTWADRSGNANTLAQSESLNHPTYESIGGLKFDGNDFMSVALPSELQGNPAITLFIVADSLMNGGRIIQLGSSTGAANAVFGIHETGSILYNDGNQTASQNFNVSPTFGSFRRVTGANKAETEFFRFGASVYLTSPSTASTLSLPSSSSSITIGNGNTGSGNDFFRGIIHEVLLFSSSLDDYNLQRVEGYLAHKWGGEANLPSNHPFKSSAPTFGGTQSITVAHTNLGTDSADNLPFMSIFDSPFDLDGSFASSGLPLTYETNNSSVLAVNAQGKLQPAGVGKVTVTFKQAGNTHFSAASNQTLNMKILGKRSQIITFGSIPDKDPSDADFTVSATASSGLPVTYTSLDTSVATITSGGTISIVSAGTATIRATQDGNDTYAPAPKVEHSFTIGDLMNVSFEPVATMGYSQSFKVRAWAYDANNGMLLNGKNGITMTYTKESGPATISGNTVTTNSSGSGDVVIKVTVSGLSYAPGTATLNISIDPTKKGQVITFLRGEKGGLGNLQLSSKPIFLGKMASANSNLPITFTLVNNPNNIAKIVGVGDKAQLLLAPKGVDSSEKFSGFDGGKELAIKIRASQAGDSSNWNAALSVDHEIKIKKPGKSAFYEARKLDSRYDTKKATFDTRMARMGKSGDKAAYLFNRDDQDSDGDGLTNLEERAFGGDSLMGDKRTAQPQAIRKGDGYEYITFKRYQDAYNEGDDRIEYIVETSRDLRTWTTDSDSTNGPLQVGNAVDVGGGMEKVVYRSREKRTDNGGKQLFIRVRVKSK